MDDCYSDNKQGTVSLPSGKSFLSFPLDVGGVDNIGLEIQSGSELIISNDRDKWPDDKNFLTFDHVNNLKIFGKGRINGQGEQWWEHTDDFRPLTIKMESCINTLIKDITVINCPNHCLELYSDHCEVDGITILNPPGATAPDGEVPAHNT